MKPWTITDSIVVRREHLSIEKQHGPPCGATLESDVVTESPEVCMPQRLVLVCQFRSARPAGLPHLCHATELTGADDA
jgi:hypothetical protein